MTEQELIAVRELVYIAKEIGYAMAAGQNRLVWQIAGSINDPDSELAQLARALDRVGSMIYPAWSHRHADEMTE